MSKYYRKPTPELLVTSTGIKYTGYQFYAGDKQSVEDIEINDPPSTDRVWYLDSSSQWTEFDPTLNLQIMLQNDLISLASAKEVLIEKVNKLCYSKIVSGFTSEALGEYYIYQSQEIDQFNTFVNMHDAVTNNVSVMQRCIKVSDGTDAFVLHTPEQIATVFREGKNYVLNLLQRCKVLKDSIISANSVSELIAIDIESGW